MKVGDLVQLSAAGAKTQQNADCVGGWGIITHINTHHQGRNYPYETKWFNRGREPYPFRFSRYELKKVKAVKKCPRQTTTNTID